MCSCHVTYWTVAGFFKVAYLNSHVCHVSPSNPSKKVLSFHKPNRLHRAPSFSGNLRGLVVFIGLLTTHMTKRDRGGVGGIWRGPFFWGVGGVGSYSCWLTSLDAPKVCWCPKKGQVFISGSRNSTRASNHQLAAMHRWPNMLSNQKTMQSNKQTCSRLFILWHDLVHGSERFELVQPRVERGY